MLKLLLANSIENYLESSDPPHIRAQDEYYTFF